MVKLAEERLRAVEKDEDKTTLITRTDYAAAFETKRMHTDTCAAPERHNMCVTVAGFRQKNSTRRKRKGRKGKRPKTDGDTETVPTQTTDVWYGLWGGGEDGGRKPCAVHFNMQREDYISYYTKGYTMHGEWFLNGKRLPRRPNGLDEPLAHLRRAG